MRKPIAIALFSTMVVAGSGTALAAQGKNPKATTVKEDRARIKADRQRLKADKQAGNAAAVREDKARVKADMEKLKADGGGRLRRLGKKGLGKKV